MAKKKHSRETYRFSLALEGFSKPSSKIEDALFGAGCDDAILYFRNRTAFLEFDRVADSIRQAILSAVANIHNADIGARVVRVEPGDPVNAAEIARRLKVTKEYVRLLIQGKRSKVHFPPPLGGIKKKTAIWSWADVAFCLHKSTKLVPGIMLSNAVLFRNINLALDFITNTDLLKQCLKLRKELREKAPPCSTG